MSAFLAMLVALLTFSAPAYPVERVPRDLASKPVDGLPTSFPAADAALPSALDDPPGRARLLLQTRRDLLVWDLRSGSVRRVAAGPEPNGESWWAWTVDVAEHA